MIRDAYEYYHPMNGGLEKIAAHPDLVVPAVDPAPPVAGSDYNDYLRFRRQAEDIRRARRRFYNTGNSYNEAKYDNMRNEELSALHNAIAADPYITMKPDVRHFYRHRDLTRLRRTLKGTDYDRMYRSDRKERR